MKVKAYQAPKPKMTQGDESGKVKLQYFGHLMQRADSLDKTLMLGKDCRKEEKGTTEDEMVG